MPKNNKAPGHRINEIIKTSLALEMEDAREAGLVVVSQHVVPLEAKASSGRPVLNSGVRSMEVVMMHPGRQFVSAML